MNKKHLELHLHTNNTCNLHCKHCYNNSGEPIVPHIPGIDQILNVVLGLSQDYELEVHMEGGEIFLRPDLLSAMNRLPESVLRGISITTNGTFRIQNSTILDMLRKLDALRISVEGHTNDQQRAIRGIDLNPVLSNAEFYRDQGIPVCLRITLNHNNIDGLVSETIPALIGRGFFVIHIYEFQQVGRGISTSDEFGIGTSLDCFMHQLEHHGTYKPANVRIMLSIQRENDVLSHRSALQNAGWQVTRIPHEEGISVHANGDVYFCAWDNCEQNVLFNIYDTGIEQARTLLRSMKLSHICKHCSAFRIIG